MEKTTISMAMFHSYVNLPEGNHPVAASIARLAMSSATYRSQNKHHPTFMGPLCSIAFSWLVYNSNFTTVQETYEYTIHGGYKPTYNVSGAYIGHFWMILFANIPHLQSLVLMTKTPREYTQDWIGTFFFPGCSQLHS